MESSSIISSTSTSDNSESVQIKSGRPIFPKFNVFKYLLVEPVSLLQGIANSLTLVILQSFYIDRICQITHNISLDVCSNLTSFPNEEKLVESTTSTYTMYQSILEFGFPIIISLFMGPYMDKYGEKRLIILPLVGWILSCGLRIMFTMMPNLPPAYLLLSSIPIGLTGGFTTYTIAIYSFMSSKTSVKSRSFRMAFLSVTGDLGSPFGIILGDKVFQLGGYLAVFITATAIYTLSLLYGVFMLPGDTAELSVIQNTESGNCCTRVFNIGAVRDTIETYFRRRSGSQRRCLILLTSSVCLNLLAWSGATSFKYLYTRNKFGWNTDVYSDYATISTFLGILGGNLLIFTTMKFLKLSDISIGVFSSLSSLAGSLIMAFADAGWEMYLGSAVQMFSSIITVVIRSMISKFIPRDEFGKVFCLVTCFELAMPFLSVPLFSFVYSSTIAVMPGVIFLVCAGALVIVLLNFIYVLFAMKNADEPLLAEIN